MSRCKWLTLLIALGGVCGCEASTGRGPRWIDKPGKTRLLTYRYSFVMSRASVPGSRINGREVERRGSASTQTEFGTLELPVTVRVGERPGDVQVAMTWRRAISGHASVKEDGETKREVSDTAEPPEPEDRMGRAGLDEVRGLMEGFRLEATFDPHANLRRYSGQSKGIDGTVAKAGEKAKTPAQWREVEQLREGFWGPYVSILQNAVVYLPGENVMLGQTWRVRRERVYPLHQYAFGMVTGAAVVSEEATCRLQDVRRGVATIRIEGVRNYIPGRAQRRRMSSMKLHGEIRVNRNTGEILYQRIVTDCTFKPGESPGVNIQFIDSLTLK